MTERRSVMLPDEAERLLANWPVPEKPPEFWNSAQVRLLERIETHPGEPTPDGLLEAPLPHGDEDSESAPASAPRLVEHASPRDSAPRVSVRSATASLPKAASEETSLVDFARSIAPRKPQSSQPDLSAREMLLNATQAREAAPTVEEPGRTQPRMAAPLRDVSRPVPVVAAATRSVPAPAVSGRNSGILIGLFAAAAAFALWFRFQAGAADPAAQLAKNEETAHSELVERPRSASPAPPSAPQAADKFAPQAGEQKLAVAENLEDLKAAGRRDEPAATKDFSLGRVASKLEAARGGVAVDRAANKMDTKGKLAAEAVQLEEGPAVAAAPTANAPAANTPSQVSEAAPEKPSSGGGAAPPSRMKPADSTSADLPEKPSSGAVQAAVASRLSAARSCVSGQKGPSSATVTWDSTGSVKSVSVSGPAAGTPAESCIKSALGAARVKPFSRPSYSVPLTIRPLD